MEQKRERSKVGNDVMEHHQQHMLFPVFSEQSNPEQWSVFKIECSIRLRGKPCLNLLITPIFCDFKVNRKCRSGDEALHHPGRAVDENGMEAFMPANQLIDSTMQGFIVERPMNGYSQWYVIGCRLGRKPIQIQEGPLTVGKRPLLQISARGAARLSAIPQLSFEQARHGSNRWHIGQFLQ